MIEIKLKLRSLPSMVYKVFINTYYLYRSFGEGRFRSLRTAFFWAKVSIRTRIYIDNMRKINGN